MNALILSPPFYIKTSKQEMCISAYFSSTSQELCCAYLLAAVLHRLNDGELNATTER